MENRAGKTAWGPMFQVAVEQWVTPRQRVIHDDLAYRLMPAYLKGMVAVCRIGVLRRALIRIVERQAPGAIGTVLCRKRYIDDVLHQALSPGIQSVVILGAGFDTRAYRLLELASRQVYEVDLPENVKEKRQAVERVLGQVPDHVHLVPIDFHAQDLQEVLRGAGYSETQATFFFWEAVMQYLSQGAVEKVFGFLRHAAVGSQLLFTYVRKDFIEGRCPDGLEFFYRTTVLRKMWRFGLDPEAVPAFLSSYGWKELEQVGNAEYQERYLRPVGRALPVMEVERAVHAEKV